MKYPPETSYLIMYCHKHRPDVWHTIEPENEQEARDAVSGIIFDSACALVRVDKFVTSQERLFGE